MVTLGLATPSQHPVVTLADSNGNSVEFTNSGTAFTGWPSGSYIAPDFQGGLTNVGLVLNRMYIVPFFLPRSIDVDRVGLEITTPAAAGGVLRFGEYRAVNGTPTTLLWETAAVSSEASPAEVVIDETVGPGVVWIAVVAQVATCSVRSPNNALTPWVGRSGYSMFTASSYIHNAVGGALPATATGVVDNDAPYPLLRVV